MKDKCNVPGCANPAGLTYMDYHRICNDCMAMDPDVLNKELGIETPGLKCAWCGKMEREGPEPYSHTICVPCVAKQKITQPI